MHLNCPECKNDVSLAKYPQVDRDQVVECDVCGISLLVIDIQNGEVAAEVADEGK